MLNFRIYFRIGRKCSLDIWTNDIDGDDFNRFIVEVSLFSSDILLFLFLLFIIVLEVYVVSGVKRYFAKTIILVLKEKDQV
ncbi:hypothetical protein SNEBB_009073 [Seison nebaliae]|nr:hypothetical protein SNEBB_009073 [Seison nebaliae]